MNRPVPASNEANCSPATAPLRRSQRLLEVVDRRPFLVLFLLILLSNLTGSFFNGAYNVSLIVNRYMDDRQRHVFWDIAIPGYNVVMYPLGIGCIVVLLRPLARCRRRLRAGQTVSATQLERCRRRLVHLPFLQVCINFLGWLPGAVVFPLVVCGLGGSHEASAIWLQFMLSFLVSALLTTAQTFFLIEAFLIRFFYPDFFQGSRPADVRGVFRIAIGWRLLLLWSAVAVPLLALCLVALNFDGRREDESELHFLALGVTAVGLLFGGFVFYLVGHDIRAWLAQHTATTEQVEIENLNVHISQLRPDEFGRLTDRVNDMIAGLRRARQLRDSFGQIVSPEIRDILQNYSGLDGDEQEVTVLFVDIRGFTRRTAGADPKKIVALLNRFLTLAVTVIEDEKGGLVNKFLGDGLMALFNVLRQQADQADQAVAAARAIVLQVAKLNEELAQAGDPPLVIGIGIHTGPALVGCIGSQVTLPDGRQRIRREFTAIGETVNFAQRMEQLTKICGGPIVLSEQTRAKLRHAVALKCHGGMQVPGYDGCQAVYQIPD
jgi:adenylate cyclase